MSLQQTEWQRTWLHIAMIWRYFCAGFTVLILIFAAEAGLSAWHNKFIMTDFSISATAVLLSIFIIVVLTNVRKLSFFVYMLLIYLTALVVWLSCVLFSYTNEATNFLIFTIIGIAVGLAIGHFIGYHRGYGHAWSEKPSLPERFRKSM